MIVHYLLLHIHRSRESKFSEIERRWLALTLSMLSHVFVCFARVQGVREGSNKQETEFARIGDE